MLTTDKNAFGQPFVRTEQVSQWALGVKEQLKQASIEATTFRWAQGKLQTALDDHSFWLFYEFPNKGKLAIRTCYDQHLTGNVRNHKKNKQSAEWEVEGSLGLFSINLEIYESGLLRYTTRLTPRQAFTVQGFPRDIYFLNADNDPMETAGKMYIKQSGPTAGLVYASVTEPLEGSFFYFQNLTSLNEYGDLTQTEPSGCVSAQWPELGFSLPAAEQPLPAEKKITLSDAFLYLNEIIPTDEFEGADQFLEAIGLIYPHLQKPETAYYDWPKASQRTIDALTKAGECGRQIHNKFYVNAYVGSTDKPPESMVQLAILVPLWEYQQWLGEPIELLEKLRQSIPSFYDEQKETIVRWLPGETFKKEELSEEEDPDKIDSWYLVHILMNLARLAEHGDMQAKELFLKSLQYVRNAAQHFKYEWPVFYHAESLKVLKAETSEGRGGELDTPGLYCHIMLQAYEMTRDTLYLDEAIRSAEKLIGKGFDLLYQSNITMMSALTLVKLWKLTGNHLYYKLSKLSIANLIARMWVWECSIGLGKYRSTFLGVAPLRDAEYLAAYEEAEIFATVLNYLKELGSDVPAPIRQIFSEYFKYLLHRGRYYFPTELPPDMISEEPREGHIAPKLPIPLEDIPTGLKKAGSVGQEVYGGAMPYILTTYAYKRFDPMPVMLFCEYPIYHAEYDILGPKQGYALFRLGGVAEFTCRVRVIALGKSLPLIQLFDATTDEPIPPQDEARQYQEFIVQGDQQIRLEWSRS